jgi:hypothetical protein
MYLYVVRVKQSRWYKIGISYAPLARMQDLQTSNPQELELCASFRRADAAARRVLFCPAQETAP